MGTGRSNSLLACLALALALAPQAPFAQDGPQGPEAAALREQRWHLPTDDGSGRSMRATVFRPAGETPRPLVVINHGSMISGNATAPVPRFSAASRWFVEQGYVVAVPQRRGYGATGGRWNESYGHCENADFKGAALEAARDLAAAVAYMRRQPFVAPTGTLIVGQSAGGWATLGYASQNPAGIPAMINFAGGRGGHRNNQPNDNCSPANLVKAAGELGRTARVPTLWVYTRNDSFFDPALATRMVEAWRAGGAPTDFQLLPPFGNDGHGLFASNKGPPAWTPLVRNHIARHR